MADNWNKAGFFSGITEDYSNYHWYKGEKENPYKSDTFHPLAASFWEYEKEFHYSYLDACDTKKPLDEAYKEWKEQLLSEHLPGKSPNPEGDTTNWEKSFNSKLHDMKNLFLFLMCLITCNSIHAQKIVKDEIDEFTGSRITVTNYISFSDGFTCALHKVNNTIILKTTYNCGDKVYSMEKGADLMLKLENDSIITLNNEEDAVAEYWSLNLGKTFIWHFSLKTIYIIPDEVYTLLKTNKIRMVRFYTTDGYITETVSEKRAKKILKLFSLLK